MLAWRDLADVEAGGSEVHAAEVARRWAEAGIEVTMRTSYAQGHPPEGERDGYRVVRRHGRFMVFPTTVRRRDAAPHGPATAWSRSGTACPTSARCGPRARTITLVHHVHKRHVAHGARGEAGPLRRVLRAQAGAAALPPHAGGHAVGVVAAASSSTTCGFRPERIDVVPPGIDARFTPGGAEAPDPLVVAVGRLMPPKRFDELIRIAAEVRDRGSRPPARHRR